MKDGDCIWFYIIVTEIERDKVGSVSPRAAECLLQK